MADRHKFRADWHDYNAGVYFVTICCKDKRHMFGRIINGEMQLSDIGRIASLHIKHLPNHYDNVEVWNHVIMPNHIHMVIAIGPLYKASASTHASRRGCLKPPRHAEETTDYHHNSALSIIIRCFKGGVKRECSSRDIEFAWQPRFHEHLIRDQHVYENIMSYIDNNVTNWDRDCFNPASCDSTIGTGTENSACDADALKSVPTVSTD